jgi:hypothetical protein
LSFCFVVGVNKDHSLFGSEGRGKKEGEEQKEMSGRVGSGKEEEGERTERSLVSQCLI